VISISVHTAPLYRGTWFDLATLTKVLFTTPILVQLLMRERMSLDDKLIVAIPDLRQCDS
jgi:CubicO group peptidase (beta-lactamase class C family)